MAKAVRQTQVGHPLLKNLWQMGVLLIGGVRPLIHKLREELDGQLTHYARFIEKRLFALALRGFAFFLSVSLIVIGFLFIAVDYGGVSRGIACLGGGLIGLTALAVWLQLAKYTRRAA